MFDIDNPSGQADNAFSECHYALENILFYPAKNVMFGPEIQWGSRENFREAVFLWITPRATPRAISG